MKFMLAKTRTNEYRTLHSADSTGSPSYRWVTDWMVLWADGRCIKGFGTMKHAKAASIAKGGEYCGKYECYHTAIKFMKGEA